MNREAAILQMQLFFGKLHVVRDHHSNQLRQLHLRLPAHLVEGLCRIADEEFHLGGAEIAGVYFDQHLSGDCIDSLFVDPFAFKSVLKLEDRRLIPCTS